MAAEVLHHPIEMEHWEEFLQKYLRKREVPTLKALSFSVLSRHKLIKTEQEEALCDAAWTEELLRYSAMSEFSVTTEPLVVVTDMYRSIKGIHRWLWTTWMTTANVLGLIRIVNEHVWRNKWTRQNGFIVYIGTKVSWNIRVATKLETATTVLLSEVPEWHSREELIAYSYGIGNSHLGTLQKWGESVTNSYLTDLYRAQKKKDRQDSKRTFWGQGPEGSVVSDVNLRCWIQRRSLTVVNEIRLSQKMKNSLLVNMAQLLQGVVVLDYDGSSLDMDEWRAYFAKNMLEITSKSTWQFCEEYSHSAGGGEF
jgi:hypothetical protein